MVQNIKTELKNTDKSEDRSYVNEKTAIATNDFKVPIPATFLMTEMDKSSSEVKYSRLF